MLNVIRTVFIIAMLLTMAFVNANAHNKVVVVPLGGDDPKPLKNVVTVAKQNGDYTSPAAALASITDASEENPYLLVIGPGFYAVNAPLVMKPYVNIVGSGIEQTVIEGEIGSTAFDGSSAIIVGADNSRLSHLRIYNAGASTFATGIFNDDASPDIRNVSVGLDSSAGFVVGVANQNSSATLRDIQVLIFATSAGVGVSVTSSNITMFNSTINVDSASAGAIGVTNANTSIAALHNIEISLSGNTTSRVGFNNTSNSAARLLNSRIRNATTAIGAGSGSGSLRTYVSNTVVEGDITGDPQCSFVFLDDGTQLDDGCDSPL